MEQSTKQKVAFDPIAIKEAGYIYVYLSYGGEGTNWVYFDDLKITHTKTNVIQYNEYYPFGLQASTSWTRENTTENNFLYNEGSELNKTSGWYETMFRNYDPSIGRFTGIDPKATKYASISSYHYSGNNPIMFNDPTGADYYAYERERKYFADMAASQGRANEQLAWEQQSSQGWFDLSGSGYGEFSGNHAICPTCPQDDPDFVFFVNDEENYWDYDPVTNTVTRNDDMSSVLLRGVTTTAKRQENDGGGPSDPSMNGSIVLQAGFVGNEHLLGPTLIMLCQPFLAKRFVTKGASQGTSIAFKTLSKVIPQTFTKTLGARAGTKVATTVGTNVIGRSLGRLVPYVGWGLLAYDYGTIEKSLENSLKE